MSYEHVYLLLNPAVKEQKECKHIIKLGKTNNLQRRLGEHKLYEYENILIIHRIPSTMINKVEQDLIKNFNEHFKKHSGIEWYMATDNDVNLMVSLYTNIINKYTIISNFVVEKKQINDKKHTNTRLSIQEFVNKNITNKNYNHILNYIQYDTKIITLAYFPINVIKMLYEIIISKYITILNNYNIDVDCLYEIVSLISELYTFKKYTQTHYPWLISQINKTLKEANILLLTTIYKYTKISYETTLKKAFTCREIELFKSCQRIFCQIPTFIDEKTLGNLLIKNSDQKIKKTIMNYINIITNEHKIIFISKQSFTKTISLKFISHFEHLNEYSNDKLTIGWLIRLITGIMDCIYLKRYLLNSDMDQNIITIESIDKKREKYDKLLDVYILNKKIIINNIK
jgi:hypothetical protein